MQVTDTRRRFFVVALLPLVAVLFMLGWVLYYTTWYVDRLRKHKGKNVNGGTEK